MAGGTKRLPRAVREQQMLDAAVQMFSVNGYHETSMDAIAAAAQISKPMLYLYYGSKEDLFGACLNRELGRFIDVVRADIRFGQGPKDLLRNAIVSFLRYIDANRASWTVMYTQAISSQTFAQTVREGRGQIIELVAGLMRVGSRAPRSDRDYEMMAVALVGAGEAMATRLTTDDIGVDDAAGLMIDLFWHGLRGAPEDREAAAALPKAGKPSAAAR
ncbi:TetR/AcrR family transcriptional regulator [Mycobacterium heidelbergense]|uniref:TetR family transcriptional regulator n=1 Tax=Mycobacterium heidelbergense TaxID=53376 RepID=A0A1X0DHE4_MYCHE|nr:TetR/AcrR family transcriptional regulator [Mycobacterium heidelbergense]MCV7049435.1 TetR/AcrR family transcriptional regulator [Mycobacterium heidelbergense]ORA71270.1 TetR family transcriptional regulator [Mycobacterium heidelbergense]BBZ49919.1 TetR family transcriptional regulator [Mycobacterium heidelbergense]